MQFKRALEAGRVTYPRRSTPADSVALVEELPASLMSVPELRQLQFSVEAHQKNGTLAVFATSQVKFYSYAGMPYYRRVGAPAEAAKLTTKLFGGDRCHAVAVRGEGCTPENPVVWYADLLAFVSFDLGAGRWEEPLAFVKWYEPDPEASEAVRQLNMPLLLHPRQPRELANGRSLTVDFTDLIVVADILHPVYIHESPVQSTRCRRRFLYNPYVV